MFKMSRLQYDIGFGLGVSAGKRKDHRAPCADKNIMSILEDRERDRDSNMSLMKGWHDGYTWQIDQELKALGF